MQTSSHHGGPLLITTAFGKIITLLQVPAMLETIGTIVTLTAGTLAALNYAIIIAEKIKKKNP